MADVVQITALGVQITAPWVQINAPRVQINAPGCQFVRMIANMCGKEPEQTNRSCTIHTVYCYSRWYQNGLILYSYNLNQVGNALWLTTCNLGQEISVCSTNCGCVQRDFSYKSKLRCLKLHNKARLINSFYSIAFTVNAML